MIHSPNPVNIQSSLYTLFIKLKSITPNRKPRRTPHVPPKRNIHSSREPRRASNRAISSNPPPPTTLNPRLIEIRIIGPIPQPGGIAADAHIRRLAGRRPVEHKHLEPARRTDVRVRRRRDGARRARARHGREEDALAHAVAVGARLGAQQGDAEVRGAAGRDGDGDGGAVRPVLVCDGVGGLGVAGEEVGRDEDLDAVLLGVDVVFRVGARDQDAAVLEEDGFGVVEAGDDGVGHDGDALADGLGGVVEEGVEVRGGGEAEARGALVRAVEDQVGPVGEGGDAGHDALGGHALEGPCRGGGFGLGGDAVVEGVAGVGGGAAADEDGEGVGVGGFLGHEDGGAFEGVCAAAEEVVDCAGDVGEGFCGREGVFVEDAGFVVVGDEDAA